MLTITSLGAGEEVEHLAPVEMPVHVLTSDKETKTSTPTVQVLPGPSSSSVAERSVAATASSPTQAAVEKARLAGNAAFASKRFDEAVSAYTEGIQMDEDNATLFGNRSAALLALGRKVSAWMTLSKLPLTAHLLTT